MDRRYDNNWLMQRYGEQDRVRFLFFWGHQAPNDGTVSKACFSQWWVAPFANEGRRYKTAEHWMMEGKARLFNDKEIAERVLAAESAAEAKKLGREVKGFDAATWEKEKFDLVVQGNFLKFSFHPALKDFLLKTGNLIIAEASPVDTVWGIGLAAGDPGIEDPSNWKGENLLGYALMEVRDRLRQLQDHN